MATLELRQLSSSSFRSLNGMTKNRRKQTSPKMKGHEDGISTNGDSGITSEEDNSGAASSSGSVDSKSHLNNSTNDGGEDSLGEGMDDVARNLKSDAETSIAGGEVCKKQQQQQHQNVKEETREVEEQQREQSSEGERDDSSPINNKRGRNDDEVCNDDTNNKQKKQRKQPNGEAEDGLDGGDHDDDGKVADKGTKNSFAIMPAEDSGSRPGRRSACSSSPDSGDRHDVNGRKRSSNSTGEEGEDEESDEQDDDDDAAVAAAESVFDNKEARGNSDSSLHRLHSSLQMAFSASSSAAGGGETTTTAASLRAAVMDSNHAERRDDNNSCNSHNSHLMQPSPKKKFKDDLTGEWVCPVCSKKLDSQHTFTVHIRQHNPTDHSHTCSICAKTLSSASSLDRHMLIHSGERPFRCRICNMAFTTNGNMHRHMRTHGSNDLAADRAGRKSKSQRDTGKLAEKRSLPDDGDSDHSNESALLESPVSRGLSPSSVSDLSAIGRSAGDLTTTAPGFANTVKTLMNGKFSFPGLGFFDLSFTDFSSQKFSSIAQTFCEHNFRKSSSPYHEFECGKCLRGFPARSALSLHDAVHSQTFCGFCRIDLGSAEAFVKHLIQHQMEGLGLSADEVSGFLRNNPFSQVNEKEGFMAMLQLHNREAAASSSLIKNKEQPSRGDEGFENASYFVHAKPAAISASGLLSKQTVDHKQTQQQEPEQQAQQHSNEGSNSFDSDAGKHDLADIQSIISVTNSGNHLKQIPAASPSLQSGTEDEESDVTKAACDSATDGGVQPAMPDSKSGDAIGAQDGDEVEEGSKESLTCKICAMQFKNAAALRKHSRSHTQGSHNYSCHLCPYTSLDKSTLVRHLRTHNGERPFQCTICKYAFTTKANCERHVRKRHKKFSKQEIKLLMQYNSDISSSATDPPIIRKTNGTNPSPCKTSFSSNHQKLYPNSSGKPVTCDEDSASLDSQEPPETTCKQCSQNFLTSHNLLKHLRSTSSSCSQTPFVCTLCQCGFSSQNNCLNHIRNQHAGVEDKLKAILFRGESIAVNNSCSSDFSDEEPAAIKNGSLHSPRLSSSHPISASLSSMNLSHGPNGNKNNHIDTHANVRRQQQQLHHTLAHEKQADRNSSLAALCHVANIAASPGKPLNLTSKPDTDYDAGDEFDENNNDEQPFDLSRGSSRDTAFQPLDLALHALDLSVKTTMTTSTTSTKPKQSAASGTDPHTNATDLSARKAADILLTLQSVAARNPFPPHTGLFLPAFSPAQTAMAAALNQSSLLYPSTQQRLLHLQQGLHQATGAVNSSSKSTLSSSPSSIISGGGGKNERCFTCKICSAGFTLKSNMERHIKRKHILK